MKLTHLFALACWAVTASCAVANAATAVPITVVNYSSKPVYSTAVAIEYNTLCTKLGLPPQTPVTVRSADHKRTFPAVLGSQNDKPILWVYLSVKANERLDLVTERAAQWQAFPNLVSANCDASSLKGELQNGVVKMTLAESGWTFAFDPQEEAAAPVPAATPANGRPASRAANKPVADPLAMITEGTLEFWVDTQNRGRIANGNPATMGLVHFPNQSKVEKCKASIGADGRPMVEVTRQMEGIAKSLKVVETFSLLPGLPVLTCRIHWQNEGDQPLYIAYVGSGNGIKGKWVKPLMTNPLLERMKTPLKGILNGGETRPGWIGGLCKISMECPATGCGVGLSTLLPTPGKVGQGSMIWGCGGSGFQCNLIDPEQGQFPFTVKPHGTLENGDAFLLTQNATSTYRQVFKMWESLAAGKDPQIDPACAVFVDGEAVAYQTVENSEELVPLLHAKEGTSPAQKSFQAAFKMDFNRYFSCSGTAQLALSSSIDLIGHPVGKKEVLLATISTNGKFQVPIENIVPKPDEAAFVLEFRPKGNAALKSATIVETIPVKPTLMSPLPDASFTDIATMFRWKAIPLVVNYDVQWAKTPDFASPFEVHLPESHDQPWYLPPADKIPTPGKWYWRLRGVKGPILGEWSETRSFTVNNDHSKKPLIRPVSNENPLFTLEASRWKDYREFVPDIAPEIRPYVGIIVEGFVDQLLTIDEALRGVEKIPHSFMIRSHPPTQISLADLEWVCQNFPNFLGIQGGETLSKVYEEEKETGDGAYHRRMTQICAKYGRFYHEADGTYADDKWQNLYDKQGAFLREYGKYIIFSAKNNIIRRQFYSQSCAMGLWLGDISLQHGAWEDGGFYWQNAGFSEPGKNAGERRGILRTMPRMFWDLMTVLGMSRGCGMYSYDGQTLMTSVKAVQKNPANGWPAELWYDDYKTSDTFKRFVEPLIKGVIKHKLIPSKEEVFRNVKIAVYNDKTVQADTNLWPYYVEYGPLYANTYGFAKMGNIDGQLWEIFPNTGRYFFIPVLPQGNQTLSPAIKTLPVSALQDPAKVKEVFNAAYPAFYQGDALVNRIGNTITVMNSNENTDTPETYSLPLQGAGIKALSGKIELNSYVVGKLEEQGKQLWLQANTEYADRPTEVAVQCDAEPAVSAVPAAALKKKAWDPVAKRLNLTLDHQAGAVEITVRAN